MTAMRTGVYAILAVVVGVMLVGLIPGQLSNFTAPAVVQTANIQSGATPESKLNRTSTNSSIPFNSSGSLAPSAETTASGATTLTDAATANEATNADRTRADVGYYALWGVGIIAAFSVYLVSKRILG